jgi:hypothetical protein
MANKQENLLKLLAQLGIGFDDSAKKPEVGYEHILFISDRLINQRIHDQNKRYGKLDFYDRDLFQNRGFDDLINLNLEHIWIDNSNQHARDRLALNLVDSRDFRIVCVHNGSKKQKWIDDYNPHAIVQYHELARIKSLDIKGFIKKIESLDRSIHKTARIPLIHSNRISKAKKPIE